MITILPEPVIDPNLDNTVCSGETSGISLNTNGTSTNADEFRLESIVIDAGLVPGGTNINPASLPLTGTATTIRNLVLGESFRNLELTDLTVEYTVVPISVSTLLCEGDPEVIVLTVQPQPSVDPTISPVPVCSGEPLNFVLGEDPGNSIAIDRYIILDVDFNFPQIQPQPGNETAGDTIAFDDLQDDVFINTTSSQDIVTYTLRPIGVNGCLGDEIDIMVQINQAPELVGNLDNTVCSDDISGITFMTTGTSEPASEYFVDGVMIPAGLTPAAGNFDFTTSSPTADVNAIFNDSFTNTTNSFQTVQYFVRPNSAAGCDGPLEVIELTVEPVPVVDPSVITVQTVCGSDPLGGGTNTTNIPLSSPTITSTGDQTNNISYNIVAMPSSPLVTGFVPFQSNLPEDHVIAETLVNNSNTVQTVEYTVTAQASGAANGTGCPGNPFVITVTVEPRPQLAANLATICSGEPVDLLLAPPLPTTTTGGVDNIEYIIDNVTGDVGNVTGISPVGTSFAANTNLTDVLTLDPAINSRQTVIYEFRPMISGTACDGLPSFVTVNIDPIPLLTATTDDTDGMTDDGRICSSSFITINLSSSTDVSTTTFYTWTSTSGPNIVGATDQATPIPVPFIFQSLTNTGNAPETVDYTITPQIISTGLSDPCLGAPVTVTITVDPVPNVEVPPTVQRRCSGDAVGVELIGDVAMTTFDWVALEGSTTVDSGTGTNGDFINTVFTNTTTTSRTIVYSITPTGPGDTQCQGFANSFVVIVSPAVTGTIAMDEEICIGSTTFLEFEFTGTPPFEFIYTDGTSNITVDGAISPALIGVTPDVTTTYELLSVTDFNGCQENITGQQATISVIDLVADLNMLTPDTSCDPFTAEFQFDQRQDVTYTFDWGDGTSESFRATSTNPAQIITHPFENLSTAIDRSFMVTLTVTQPEFVSPAFCSVSADTLITVFNDIVVEAVAVEDELCGNETLQLESLSRGQTEERWSLRLAGDTSVPTPFQTGPFADTLLQNTSADTIFYEVVYEAEDVITGCLEQEIIPVTVFPEIVVDFTVDPLRQTFPGLTINLQNNSQNRNSFLNTWDFGDGNTSNDPNLTSYTYETFGSFDVTLTIENAICSDQQTIRVVIDPSTPIAAFESDTLGCSGQTVFDFVSDGFTMGVDDQSQFFWEFGDGTPTRQQGTSFLRNPSYTYQEPGQYQVSLTVTNSSGRSDVATSNITVGLTPVASFVYAPIVALLEADPDNPGGQISEVVRFNNQSIGGNDFTWDFGDGNTANEENTTHQYTAPGLFDVSLIVRNVVFEDLLVCSDDITITDAVLVRSGGSLEIPNAFTPDPSGPSGGRIPGGASAGDAAGELENNFVFLPRFSGAVEFQMEIFNKWGERIFISNDQTLGWDGFVRGQRAEQGVYLYRISVVFVNGEAFTKLGDVTLIW